MRTGRMLAVSALLLLVAAVPAAAETGGLQGRMALPLEVQGLHTASAADGSFLLQGADGAASLLVQGSEGKAERVVHRAFGFVNPQDPKLEVVWEDRVERIPLDVEGAFLTLTERRPEFTLLATDAALQLGSGPVGGDLLVGLLQDPKSVDYVLDDRLSIRLKDPMANDGFSALLPAGLYQARAFDGRASASGPLTLFVHGATLSYLPAGGTLESIPAHFRIEQRSGTLYNPLTATWSGPGSHTEYVEEYLLL
ncbi:MAG TPA: hypothetical protein VI796_04155, partial [Candidatus Thermoplasmatota archaeon]|nr:hypothetical protein [Candidatus Thermoplasmatota archaeon]